jgi:hypothetical protein
MRSAENSYNTFSLSSRLKKRGMNSKKVSGRAVHFVGFRGDEYWSAAKVWGRPGFIHRGWDKRATMEVADGDIVIFATGQHDQIPRDFNFNDIA